MRRLLIIVFSSLSIISFSQPQNLERGSSRIYLDSKEMHDGGYAWEMMRSSEVHDRAEDISSVGYATSGWMPAVVPGTVLTSLVHNNVYPDPYFGLNNKKEGKIIPDISDVGLAFYTYWFRTEFNVPESYEGKVVWLMLDGINYRADIWLNGHKISHMDGMFKSDVIDISDFANVGSSNALAIKVTPVDMPGTTKPKSWSAVGEWHNGGDGNIGLNTTMLMSVGWDFTFNDGVRDRNTGIWKSVSLFATNGIRLAYPFVKSVLRDNYSVAEETVEVEVCNPTLKTMKCQLECSIANTGIVLTKSVEIMRGCTERIVFTPKEFPQLVINNPKLWWPLNKGDQYMYELDIVAKINGTTADHISTRFGIREIKSDQNTPDKSRQFYVNGKRIFVRGTNWIPEAMLRTSDARTYRELRLTRQSGINFIRLWGGGIAESDYFYQLCDEMGFLVWQEFWMTGDTKHPHDGSLYMSNIESTVKRIRNHPSIAYYVSSNESTEMPGAKDLLMRIDGTRGYQMQSECDGVHDGSPYKQVNPMQHYENTASDRGSRVDGFNPEYGAPTVPLVSSLRRFMAEKDLWPINKEVWDYHDGGGFHLMTSLYTDLVDKYGTPKSIEDFCQKGQFLGAMNSKSIWEVWNENKYDYGDRYASGLLFWYHNCPVPQVCGRMWDYYLEPTASLYHTQNALQPLHPQFDYLTNSVSIVNDYTKAFAGFSLTAKVFDLNGHCIWSDSKNIDIPEDGVCNDVMRVQFPSNISNVHFIKLYLYDDKGHIVGDNFYWRSNDKYEGKITTTGPCTSGFGDLKKLPMVKLSCKLRKRTEADSTIVEIVVKNKTGNIAFFTELHLTDGAGKYIQPCYITDNFFSLTPGETKLLKLDVNTKSLGTDSQIEIKGWNIQSARLKI